MLTNIRRSTLGAALRMGGFIGWYLTVMYICEQSLRFYRDDSMLSSVNVTFLLGSFLTAAVISVLLLLLDIEGLLSDKILRWLPGVFMAESGIALSLANASTMTAFSAVAGFGSAFGALAVLSHLQRVKVGQRMTAIALGLALGGAVRLLAVLLIGSSPTKSSLMVAAIAIGILAALSVHSNGYSKEGSPLVSLAEAEPRRMLSQIPGMYAVIFICSALFYFAHSHIEALTAANITGSYSGYAAVASLGFILASFAAAMLVKLPWLAMLFVFGSGLSAASGILAGLPYLTASEAAFFAFISYAALACIKAGLFIIVVIFSLDRPHPLFYSFIGYTAIVGGELVGRELDRIIDQPQLSFYIWLLILMIPVSGGLIAYFLRRAGFTQQQLDHRHTARSTILRRCAELELLAREQTMVEHIVLDGCGPEELSSKMLYSRNTIKVMLQTLLPKFGAKNLDDLRAYFGKLTENEEKFLAEVQAAEAERRATERVEQAQHRREEQERRREEKAERAAAREREIAEENEALDIVDITLGGEDNDEPAAEENIESAAADESCESEVKISAEEEAPCDESETEADSGDEAEDASDAEDDIPGEEADDTAEENNVDSDNTSDLSDSGDYSDADEDYQPTDDDSDDDFSEEDEFYDEEDSDEEDSDDEDESGEDEYAENSETDENSDSPQSDTDDDDDDDFFAAYTR